jgi:tetratricopeptide (TPR) repeat protein
VTNVIRLDGGAGGDDAEPSATGIAALRLITGMDAEEFAAALGNELGWPVPVLVYLQWERDRGIPAPPETIEAARKVALRNTIRSGTPRMDRRYFLGSVVGLSALAATGFPIQARTVGGTPNAAGTGSAWRTSPETAADLEMLVASYRRAYAGKSAVADLLPGTGGLMHLLIDLGRHDQWPGPRAQLASLIGQTALLAGLLHLMGPRDLEAAKTHYDLALVAAREAEDWDLASYVMGSLAFQAHSARRPTDAQTIIGAAWDLTSRHASPRTRAWAAALASELHARAGDELRSGRLLETALGAMEKTREEPSWKGVGWFDKARLLAYNGGNLLILGKYTEAEDVLRSSLKQLDPIRLKHRSTTSADLAMSLAQRGEVEESCAYASRALSLATSISHRESINRVRGVHFRLLQWRTDPAVRQLTEQLEAA